MFGLLGRGNLLGLLRNFIVFETEDGKTVKKVARYQQFRAANELVSRALQLGKPCGWRWGIVWHTQGSGNSLTILVAARKLWSLSQIGTRSPKPFPDPAPAFKRVSHQAVVTSGVRRLPASPPEAQREATAFSRPHPATVRS